MRTTENYKFNVGLSNLQDRKTIHEFEEEVKFDFKNIDRKSIRDRSIVELLKSQAIMASGNST